MALVWINNSIPRLIKIISIRLIVIPCKKSALTISRSSNKKKLTRTAFSNWEKPKSETTFTVFTVTIFTTPAPSALDCEQSVPSAKNKDSTASSFWTSGIAPFCTPKATIQPWWAREQKPTAPCRVATKAEIKPSSSKVSTSPSETSLKWPQVWLKREWDTCRHLPEPRKSSSTQSSTTKWSRVPCEEIPSRLPPAEIKVIGSLTSRKTWSWRLRSSNLWLNHIVHDSILAI